MARDFRGNLEAFTDSLQMVAYRRREDRKPEIDIVRLQDLMTVFNVAGSQLALFHRLWEAAQNMHPGSNKFGWEVLSETHSKMQDLFY